MAGVQNTGSSWEGSKGFHRASYRALGFPKLGAPSGGLCHKTDMLGNEGDPCFEILPCTDCTWRVMGCGLSK